MDIIFLIIGIVSGFVIAHLYFKPQLNEVNIKLEKQKTKLKNLRKKNKTKSNTSKEKGNLFEIYVIQKFNLDFFDLERWNADNYVETSDGKKIYPKNSHYPDLELNFNYHKENIKQTISVECKWRNDFFKDGVVWCETYQLNNYKKFQKDRQIPVFLAIGIGGSPDNPDSFYIIPLMNISNRVSLELENNEGAKVQFMHKDFLRKFQKSTSDKFFFDYERNFLN